MFYSDAILSKKGALAKVWLAAHMESRLTKGQVGSVDVEQSVSEYLRHFRAPLVNWVGLPVGTGGGPTTDERERRREGRRSRGGSHSRLMGFTLAHALTVEPPQLTVRAAFALPARRRGHPAGAG
jgi:hypothetical protein